VALSFLYRLVRRTIELLRVRRLGGLEKDVENQSCRGPSGNGGNGTTSLLIAECQRGWIPYLLESVRTTCGSLTVAGAGRDCTAPNRRPRTTIG
jgi:hypothetical protein